MILYCFVVEGVGPVVQFLYFTLGWFGTGYGHYIVAGGVSAL